MVPKMAPKKATKQSSITSMGFPLLQKPAETCVGRQIQVLGSYWTGRMSTEEANSLYKCTVRDFHALHKWDAGGTPSQAMELQEMGVDGQGSRETGGSSADRIFFMKYHCRSYNTGTQRIPHHSRTQRQPVLQLFPPHLLVGTQTWQVKGPRE